MPHFEALVMFFYSDYNVYIPHTYTHRCIMRTNIVIDDDLMAQALKATGLEIKKDDVEQRLKLREKRKKQQPIGRIRGHLTWEGKLEKMRDNE